MRSAATVVLCCVCSLAAQGQGGQITGVVRDDADRPLAGAHLFIAGLSLFGQSRDDGTFLIRDVPPGAYEINTVRIGYRPTRTLGVVVRAGVETRVAIQVEATPMRLEGVVIAVSRRAERIADAPAMVTAFDATTIANSIGSMTTEMLKQAPGVTLTQVGITSSFVNGRGFNKLFNMRWLTLEDGRVAAMPETGLAIGEHTTIPKLDMAGMEVITGPGSALYGANASSGVLSERTKDPAENPGLSLEATGGARNWRDVQLRYAGVRGHFGFKIAAQDQSASDWSDIVYYPAVTPGGASLRETPADFDSHVRRVSGSLRYDLGTARLQFNAGASVRDGLGQAQGRYQIANYQYQNYQATLSMPHWFAQAYATRSNSGDTYRLQIETQARARFTTLTADSIRALSAFPVDGRILATEVRYDNLVGNHLHTGFGPADNAHVTLGAQALRTRISSYGRVYTDAQTHQPIVYDQLASYAQVESPLTSALRFIGAARYDRRDLFAAHLSPEAGLVYDMTGDHSLRLTYNAAYMTPGIIQTDVYGLNAAARVINVGNSDGFDVRDAAGVLVGTVKRIAPETNQTWEVGYKGMIAQRLFVDIAAYHTRVRDFMTLPVLIANPLTAAPTYAFNHRTGQRVNDPSGNALQTYSFLNVGDGSFGGIDAALRYNVNNHVGFSSTLSLTRLDTIMTAPTDPPEATAFNTSPTRSTVTINVVDVPKNLQASVTTRYVAGYPFRSGTDWGQLPSFATLGLSVRYRQPAARHTLLLQVDNLVSCVGGTTTPPVAGISAASQATYTPGRSCGPSVRHHEILNMPPIGVMLYAGVRYEPR